MNIGQNTANGQQLLAFIERMENLTVQRKALGDDMAAVMAEAKATGFVPAAIRHCLKVRAMKPHVRQEAEAMADMYLHAIGMEMDTPLFRQVGLMSVDIAARDQVIEALKAFVPEDGSITVDAGGKPVKLTRGKDGEVTVAEVVTPPPAAAKGRGAGSTAASSAPRAPVPDVDADAAEALGRQAFKDNVAIIANPFPFGDARRPRWDEGWRRESGTDGMGPGKGS